MLTPHVVAQKSPLLQHLLAYFPAIKKTKVKQFLKYGSVTVNGAVITRSGHPLNPGDKIGFLTKAASLKEQLKTRLDFPIVYEDDELVVIDKPAGLLTMGTDKDKIHTAYYELTAYIRSQSKDGRGRVFIVHRLDREASGLVVFAKRESTKRALQENWQDAVKKYFAVVEGNPEKSSGTIDSYLVEDKFRRVFSASERTAAAKHAVTRYKTLSRSGSLTLLDVTLVTGRKNQIRVHLSDLGCPILGDVKYGSASNPAERLGLHAYYLSFKNPTTGEIKTFKSTLPAPLAELFPKN